MILCVLKIEVSIIVPLLLIRFRNNEKGMNKSPVFFSGFNCTGFNFKIFVSKPGSSSNSDPDWIGNQQNLDL
jgi:hypothetical protein